MLMFRIAGWLLVVGLGLLALSDIADDGKKAPERTAGVLGKALLIAWIVAALTRT